MVVSMLTFDVSMPFMLFVVTVASLLLGGRTEQKLKTTFEEREFKTRDVVLFVVLITAAVSIIVFVPGYALLAVFLFSYSSLLFTFAILFSNMPRRRAQVFFVGVGLAALASSVVSLVLGRGSVMFYGGIAALALAAFSFGSVVYEQLKAGVKTRWHLAASAPWLFLVVFFLFMYGKNTLLALVLLDVSGALFAVLITLYLVSLFTWKVTFVFAALLTVMDIILVLVTGFMVQAAEHVAGLGLPVLIALPTSMQFIQPVAIHLLPSPLLSPFILTIGSIRFLSLGLGDFFFAGTLATQTLKKYGQTVALVAAVTMTLSFAVFESALLSTGFGAFPGTLMIIVGWLPVVGWKMLSERKRKQLLPAQTVPQVPAV
jgi:hypothetical protein